MVNDKAVIDLIQKILKGQNSMTDDIKVIKTDVKIIRSDVNNLNDQVIEINSELKRVNNRIDILGNQLANLDDDAPSGEDFSNLEDRVIKIEQTAVFA